MALIDDVIIRVKAGHGGAGSASTVQAPTGTKRYSDGGNGGNGGDIFFQASSNISDLSEFRFTKVIKADNGENGQRKNKQGKSAIDKVVLVPPGTKVIDEDTGEEIEILTPGEQVLIARGGRGGMGSHGFRPSMKFQSEHEYTNEGALGESKNLHLILSLIADAGLIGFPNAGKSSLLATLTRANPKIGNYPFTTLEPSLGTMLTHGESGGGKIVLADIPGLIEGASSGKGLGITFLKHIEKTKVLLHCIDATDPDPESSYNKVKKEFEEFNVELNEKREIILLTKKDLVSEDELNAKIAVFSKMKKTVITVSIYDEESIKKLSEVIKENVV